MVRRSGKMKKQVEATTDETSLEQQDSFMARIMIKTYGAALLAVWVAPVYYILETLATEQDSRSFSQATFYGAWLICIGCATLAAFLPPSFFELRFFEHSGSLYARLGVKRFKFFVNNGDGMRLIFRSAFPRAVEPTNSASMQQWLRQGVTNERVHWSSLFGTAPVAVWSAVAGHPWFTLYLALANVPANVYPILLQRYTRARLLPLLRKRLSLALQTLPSNERRSSDGFSLEEILSRKYEL